MNEVDKRVVQMEFDNKKFEQNVSETIKSLQKLDEALKINSSTDGLEKTGKSANKLDKELSNVNDTLVDTRDHFSAIEVIGVTALATLTNSAVKAGAKIARSFNKPLSLAISGGKSRSQNIANAKFMLEGLGVEWEQISDDINYGVKSTAYGLDAAAKVASQLVASNVSLGENMRNSLRAVSGVAAMTNSTYEEIGEIFTTVAGQGKLMTMQLRQLEARGLNVAASLGKVMNKTESEIRDMVTAGKIGFQDFANAMDEAFGAHAKEANKTFSGALSNTKAALSRLGEAFATPTFEAVRRVLNSLIPIIDKISKQLKPLVAIYTNIIDGIAGVFEKIGTNLKYSDLIEKMGYAFYTWIAAIRTALRVVGIEMPDVFTGIRTLNKLVDKFTLSGKKADTVVKIFATLFQTIKLINTVIKSIWKIAFPILNLAVKLLGIIFGVSGDFFEILYQVEGKLIRILDVVSSLIAVGLGEAINVIITLLSAIKFEYIIKALHVILGIVAALASVVMQLAGVLVVLVGGLVAGIPAVLSSILGVFGDLMGGANVITDLIRSVFGRKKKTTLSVDTEGLADAEDVEKTADAVKNLNKHLPTTEKNARGISKAVSAVSKEVKTLNKETTKVTSNAEKSARTVNKSLGGLKESLTDIVPQNDHSKKNEEDGSVIQRATGDADRAKYYADKAKTELDENEKESKNAFQRFFSHIADVLKAGGNLIKTTVMGVIGVIAFAFSKMAEIIKSLNWFKIIGIAAVGIAVFIVYEILRAIHSVISAFAAIGNLAKGYADRGAALKFHAMAGVILAFGAVLVALMITIDKVDTNKLVAGLTALTGLITRVGVFVLAMMSLYTAMQMLAALSGIFTSISRIMNVSRNQLIISPILKILMTYGLTIGLICAAIISFTKIIEKEGGQARLWKATTYVLNISAVILSFLLVLTWAVAKISKGLEAYQTDTTKKTSLFKGTVTTHTTDPLQGMSNVLFHISKMLTKFLAMVVGFALLSKIFGEDKIKTAIRQTLTILIAAAVAYVTILGALALFANIMRTGKVNSKGVNQALWGQQGKANGLQIIQSNREKSKYAESYSEISKYLKSATDLMSIFFSSVKKFLGMVVALTAMNKYLEDENVDKAISQLLKIMVIVVGAYGALLLLIRLLAKPDIINAQTNKIKAQVESISKTSDLIKDAIIPLVTRVLISIAALALISHYAKISPSDMTRLAVILVGSVAALAILGGLLGKFSKQIEAIKVEKLTSLLLLVDVTMFSIIGMITVLAGLLVILEDLPNVDRGAAILSRLFIFVTILSAVIAAVVIHLSKTGLDQGNLNAALTAMGGAIVIASALIGAVAAMTGLVIIINKADITGSTMDKLFAITTIVGAIAAVVAIITAYLVQIDMSKYQGSLFTLYGFYTLILTTVAVISGIISILATTLSDVSVDYAMISSLLIATTGVIIALVGFVAVIVEKIKKGAITMLSLVKTIGVLIAAVGALTILAGLIPILAEAARDLQGVDLSGLMTISLAISALGLVFTAIAWGIAKAKGGDIAFVSVLAFAALLVGFYSFVRTLKRLADVINEVAPVLTLKLVIKLNAFYIVFMAMFGIIFAICEHVAAANNTIAYTALALGTVIFGALQWMFYQFALAVEAIGRAAYFSKDVDPKALVAIVTAVITELLPMMTQAALTGIQNFVLFTTNLASALSNINTIMSGSFTAKDPTELIGMIRNFAELLPEIIRTFESLDNAAALKIKNFGEGLIDVTAAIRQLADNDFPSHVEHGTEALSRMFELFDNITLDNMVKMSEKIDTFTGSLNNLAPTLVIVAAALFVASLVFNGAFLSMASGPMMLITIFGLLFSGLSEEGGPLASFRSFVDNMILESDSLIAKLLEVAFAIGDMSTSGAVFRENFFEVGIVGGGVGSIAGAIIGGSIAGPAGIAAGAKIGAVAGAAFAETSSRLMSAFIPDIDLPTQESATALEMIINTKTLSDDGKVDLSKLSTQELEFALDAFTDEFAAGKIQEGEDRETMIELISKIYDELLPDKNEPHEKKGEYDPGAATADYYENKYRNEISDGIKQTVSDAILQNRGESDSAGEIRGIRYYLMTKLPIMKVLSALGFIGGRQTNIDRNETLSWGTHDLLNSMLGLRHAADKFDENFLDYVSNDDLIYMIDELTKSIESGAYSEDQAKTVANLIASMTEALASREEPVAETVTDLQYYMQKFGLEGSGSTLDDILAVNEKLLEYDRQQAQESKNEPNLASTFFDLSGKLHNAGIGFKNAMDSFAGFIPSITTGASTGGGLGQAMDIGLKPVLDMSNVTNGIALAKEQLGKLGPEIQKTLGGGIDKELGISLNNDAADVISDLWDQILGLLGDGYPAIRDKISEFAAKGGEGISELVDWAKSNLKDKFPTLYNKIADLLNPLGYEMDLAGEVSGEMFGNALGDTMGAAVINAYSEAMKTMASGVTDLIAAYEALGEDKLGAAQIEILNKYRDVLNTANAAVERHHAYRVDQEQLSGQELYQKLLDGVYDIENSPYMDGKGGGGGGGGAGDPTGAPTESAGNLANNISRSSGLGSGINDRSKSLSGSNGGDVTNIDSNNVTYNYVQNNYSPEALSRIDIYRQTNNQLKTVFDALKG